MARFPSLICTSKNFLVIKVTNSIIHNAVPIGSLALLGVLSLFAQIYKLLQFQNIHGLIPPLDYVTVMCCFQELPFFYIIELLTCDYMNYVYKYKKTVHAMKLQ